MLNHYKSTLYFFFFLMQANIIAFYLNWLFSVFSQFNLLNVLNVLPEFPNVASLFLFSSLPWEESFLYYPFLTRKNKLLWGENISTVPFSNSFSRIITNIKMRQADLLGLLPHAVCFIHERFLIFSEYKLAIMITHGSI